MAMDGKPRRRVRAFSSFLLFLLFVQEAQLTSFTFSNNCNYTVWAGTLSGATSPSLSETGFKLTPASSTTVSAPPGWSGRFWGRTLCSTDSTGKFSCTTADCATGTIPCNGAGSVPPATLAEITLSNNGGQDFYDISLVDGFNLPMSLSPAGGHGDCEPASCAWDVNTVCPSEMQVTSESSGAVIACKSACNAFGDAKYCCTGAYASPSSCKPTNYSKLFKDVCPDAYSFAFDDPSSTFTCIGASTYLVTFCP
ncbi:Thaumatin family protein [Dioscorea alata]|uniref:Thaumatin family protein n=1 Tax=Dioscorea alata TaxID=55571 RepID=A0ACB7UQB6_DIOAL|nr:Thaumatin family protein [Dioscorea alata]